MATNFNKDSNYNENESFSRVLFGSEAPLLEVELNELQQIITTKFSRLIKMFGQGVYGLADNSFAYASGTLTVTNAVIIQNDGMTAYVQSASAAVANGARAYFRLEEATATASDTLKAYGNTAGSNVTNTIQDSRSSAETSRRKVIKYTLMSGASVPSDTSQYKYVSVGYVNGGNFVEESDMKVADKTTLDRVAKAVGAADEGTKIYGLRIDKNDSNPATRCKYLMDAVGMTPAKMNFSTGQFDYGDWGDVWFVKDNFPCMLRPDGTIDYKLNPNDYTKKEDGTDSGVADTTQSSNAMSAIPTVWIKQYESGRYKYIFLAQYQVDETYHAYAHEADDGTIESYVFLSIFNGVQVGSSTTLRSLSGIQPMHSKTAENEIAYAVANGDGWFTKTWSQRNLIQCLLKMIACNTNSQAVFGNGNLNYVNDSSVNYNKLPTGTLNDKGQFYGYNDNTHQVKVFHIEGFWANLWDRIAGLVNDKGIVKAKMTAPYPTTGLTTASTFDGYAVVGKMPEGTNGGYIKDTVMSEYGDIPYLATGSATTYECDGLWFNNSQLNYALVGGLCADSSLCGSDCLYLNFAASYANWRIGASLSFLKRTKKSA